eukprot:scaffold45401_cov53-Attheya_sp.AAC.3
MRQAAHSTGSLNKSHIFFPQAGTETNNKPHAHFDNTFLLFQGGHSRPFNFQNSGSCVHHIN